MKTILLVEDELIISAKQARDLAKEGYRVIEAPSGPDAIRAVEEAPDGIDLILMDIDLGRGMDGTDAAREILSRHTIPVVFLSSHTEKDIVDKTEKITSYGYVVKNTGITVLAASIRMAFRLFEAHTHISMKSCEIETMNEELNATLEEMAATNEELTRSQNEILEHEKALGESEKKYRFLVENMTDVVWQLSTDFRFTFISQAVERMSGHRPEELIGKPATEIMTPRSAALVVKGALERLELARQGKKLDTWVVQVENVAKDGRIIWTEVISQPIYGETGDLTGYQGVTRDITMRKHAEDLLIESEQKYSSIINGTAEGILIAEIATRRFIFANPAICDMFGYNAGELIGMSVDDIHPAEDLPRVMEKFQAQARGEIKVAPSLPCLRKDGTIFYADICTTPILMNGTTCNMGFFSDITDRMKAEKALKSSEAKYRALAQNIPGMVYRAYRDWSAEFLSNCESLTGYTSAEINSMGKRWLSIVHPEDAGRVSGEGSIMAKKETIQVQTYRIMVKGGAVKWVEDHKVSLFTKAGEFDGIEGFGLDITRRKETEQMFIERQLFIEGLLESLTDGLTVFDRKGKRIMVNRAFCEMTGFSREELLGDLPLNPHWPPEEREGITRVHQTLMRGELTEKEIVLMRKNGERFPVILTPSYMKDETERILYSIVTLKDITERRRVHEELRRNIQDKEILMVELQHRVKNSLLIIQSLLSMEMENLADEGPRTIFQNTLTRIQSMSAIYEQLYSSASINRIDLRDYLREIVENLIATYAPQPSLIRLHPEMEEVSLDLKRSVSLGLIINELVTNAIKYAYPAGKEGDIGLTLKRGGGTVTIAISDRGKGMKEFLENQKSKGIGMHLVQLLIRQLGGELVITGDRGTRAEITFPL